MAAGTENATAPTAITVGTGLVQLLAGTPGYRRSLVIQNVHASNDLFLGFFPTGTDATGAAALTTGTGIRIPAGGSFIDNSPNAFSGAVYGRASASGTDVRVLAF